MKESHDKAAVGHRRFLLLAALLAGILGATVDAHAYHHPTLGRFVQRDPSGYGDGMNLYEYGKSNPVVHTDPSGEAVVMFGGGIYIFGRHTGEFFMPPVFKSLEQNMYALKKDLAKRFPGTPEGLEDARKWLKKLKEKTTLSNEARCKIRIVGYSSGCATALRLGQEVAKRQLGLVKGTKLKALVFYDFNWGSAAQSPYKDVLKGDFSRPEVEGLRTQHVTSGGWVIVPFHFTRYFWFKGAFGEPYYYYKPGMSGLSWTLSLWHKFPNGIPEEKMLRYTARYLWALGNTSGEFTYRYVRNGWWLRSNAHIGYKSHFRLRSVVTEQDVINRLYGR